MKRIAVKFCLVALVTGALTSGSTSAFAANNGAQGSQLSVGEEVRFGPTLEESLLIGVVGEPPAERGVEADASNRSGDVGTMAIPLTPHDVFQCDIVPNADHVVTTVQSWEYRNGNELLWPGGDIDLLCGKDDTSGYKHIRHRHQWGTLNQPNAWETVRSSASDALGYSSPQPWDWYMLAAATDTINQSFITIKNSSAQKVCFSAPWHIWKDGIPYATYYANTIVSSSNFTIVTAFPSNRSQGSACWQGL